MIRTFTLLLSLLFVGSVSANNIQVAGVEIIQNGTTSDDVYIRFDVVWENSWRNTTGDATTPENYDAAWVFAKFSVDGGPWRHVTLRDQGSEVFVPANAALDIFENKGAMIYRSITNTSPGDATFLDVTLNWDYANDGYNGGQNNVRVEVFAIEMVYVPQASFFLGSGGQDDIDPDPVTVDSENTETNEFYTYDTGDPLVDVDDPYVVTSEAAITVGETPGALYYRNVNSRGGDRLGPIPTAFPKGYDDFYIQKYETTQGQWVAFFNTLTPTQKLNRDVTAENGKEDDIVDLRNGVIWTGSGDAATDPGNPRGGEYENVPMNFISQADMLAYFDWAALRPMTELEYEKVSKGPASFFPTPEPNAFSWNTPFVSRTRYDLTLRRTPNEIVTGATVANTNGGDEIGNANYDETVPSSGSERGPFRTGIFMASVTSSNRINGGVSYYGASEMSGNLYEGVVTVGTPQGRAFTNTHGDGELTAAGEANVASWPIDTRGLSIRGGAFDQQDNLMRVSDRSFGITRPSTLTGAAGDADALATFNNRRSNLQFRGVRGSL